ncbi:uncharacterized protein (TIGR02588 family) [Prosthecobacter fusiformis]|uniref:Uncharacterized protein (TIGR02588 family) n=1 Tax=Prosthecobacter fusiformis TaxID=48464 RepID=A0A4R7RJP4_9BACT|nr:hypothetical protein [Prosthecobacter fusiformis]TDU64348.1 uncharacterized protein (TIGR02588 family) [Prosthecobacter fusiformis]
MATPQKNSSNATANAAPEIPLAEWIASGVGLLLVAATVGYLAYAAATQEDGPPDIRVEVLAVQPLRHGYVAQFRAINEGQQAASDVHITGVLGQGAESEESAAVLDFLPAGSEKGGGLFFTRDPSASPLTLRATGFQKP